MKILLIGLGSAGQRHLRALDYLFASQAEIYVYRGKHSRGLISKDLKSEDFSLDPIEVYKASELMNYSDLDSMHWDLVIIATPPDSHFEYFRIIVPVSRRIIIEKPISVTAREAKGINDLAKSFHIPVLIGYQLGFHPLKKLISSNLPLLGVILSCATTYKEDLARMNPFRDMNNHHLSTQAGGGVFPSLSHDLEFLLSIFNQTSIQNPKFANKSYSQNKILSACLFQSCMQTQYGSFTMTNELSLLPGEMQRNGLIQGTDGRIFWDFISGTFTLADNLGQILIQESIAIDKDELFRFQIRHIMEIESPNEYCISNLERSVFITQMSQLASD